MTRKKLPDHDEWLAAEYALGVLPSEGMAEAERRVGRDASFRAAVEGWHNQLEPLLGEVEEKAPPASVWKAIESEIGISAESAYAKAGNSVFWKWVSGISTAVAVAAVSMFISVTDGDLTGERIAETKSQLERSLQQIATLNEQLSEKDARIETTAGALELARQEVENLISDRDQTLQQTATQVASLESTLAAAERQAEESNVEAGQVRQQLAENEQQLLELNQQLELAQSRVESTAGALELARQDVESAIAEKNETTSQLASLEADLRTSEARAAEATREVEIVMERLALIEQEINSAVPLVASLTAQGDLPAFVAQYDPIKRSLLIRTSAVDADEKVPEIWFIPEIGERKGDVISLGVMNEDAPDQIAITDEFVPWMDEGGTLAITMEPPGGSPTGVATGPIIAIGKLQALQ